MANNRKARVSYSRGGPRTKPKEVTRSGNLRRGKGSIAKTSGGTKVGHHAKRRR